jgi:AraC-like DNA-binding protein
VTKALNETKQISRPGPGDVPAPIARDLLRLIAEHGGEATEFLRSAGLSHLRAVLVDSDDPRLAIPHRDFVAFYRQATALLDAAAAWQEGRDSLTKSGVDMMCHAVITCRTLRHAIARMDQFSALLAPRTARLRLLIIGNIARLDMATIRQVRNGCSYLSDLTGLATYHRLFGWLIGEDIPLQDATLRYPPLLDAQTVAYLLPRRPRHDQPENSLFFPAHFLDRPVVRSPQELDLFLERFPFDPEEPQSKETPLSARIVHLFTSVLASGEALYPAAILAQTFSISIATLKRRLEAEGTSLRKLKVEARRELAIRLLDDPRLTITEICRRTHFSDPGAFRRAFRQWTGQSPSRWRKSEGTKR